MTLRHPATAARRLARYAALAPAIATPAFATIYGASGLNHEVGFGGTAGAGGVLFQIGGQNVTVSAQSSSGKRGVSVLVAGADFQNLSIRSSQNGVSGTWSGGIPVYSGASWNNIGRTTGEFAGNAGRNFSARNRGSINFSNTRASWASNLGAAFVKDPQGVGNTGQTWYLLFKFWSGAHPNTYGWLSFNAFVDPASQNDSIVVTGWGWDDSGTVLAAGIGPVAVPGGTGLAALAIGAAGLRGRRRSRRG